MYSNEPSSDAHPRRCRSGVGKSCLLARFTNQIWAPYTTPTTGVDYVMGHFVYNDRVYEEHLWDPSGSEQYDDVRQKYYKGVKSFWLVYDVTNRQSFENIRKWTASVRQLATNMKSAYLFGCKADMDNKRAVWPAEAEALSKELRLKWAGEMSAKTNQGIQKQFGSRAQVLKSVSIR
ncbi:GTP-binding protein [Tulasnella sp. 330]|nr:GTP-binding protein [Tulasnella sp. 330]